MTLYREPIQKKNAQEDYETRIMLEYGWVCFPVVAFYNLIVITIYQRN